MAKRRLVPSLWYTHYTFFIIYFIVAFHHFGMAMSQWFDRDRYASVGFDVVYEMMPLSGWVLLHLVCWGMLTLGAYHKFLTWGRLGLALGLLLSLYRGLAFQMTPTGGGALIVWIVIAGTHFVQLLEPPANPLTTKE